MKKTNNKYCEELITLNNVEIAFPCLFEKCLYSQEEKKNIPSLEGAYFATLLIDKIKQKKLYNDINLKIENFKKECGFNKEIIKNYGNFRETVLTDGDFAKGGVDIPEYYKGKWKIWAKNKREIHVVDENGHQISDKDKIYGGCIVNANLQLWIQDSTYSGVRVTLIAVQFVSDGEPHVSSTISFDKAMTGFTRKTVSDIDQLIGN